MSASRPGPNETDTPCPAFGSGCGGFLNSEGVCTTCGAVVARASSPDPGFEVDDDEPDYEDISDPEAYLSPNSVDALADDAADRHYNRD